MKNILLIVFALVSYIAVSQDINQFDANGKRHGIWKKDYKNTKVMRYQGEFNHGKEIGVFKYYKNIESEAVLFASRTFNTTNDIAEVKFVSTKGAMVSEGKMLKKTYIGKWLYYHKDSKQIMTEELYNDKGELNGEKKTYYLSGKLAESANYKANKLDGDSKWYSEKAVLIRFYSYKAGLLEGPTKAYDAKGDVIMEGVYRDDKKHGIWNYYENGKFVRKKDFTRRSKNPKYKKKKQ